MLAPSHETASAPSSHVLSEAQRGALAFEAPYLVDKLLKERIVGSAEEAEELFTEVKRYLVLSGGDRSTAWEMHSLRVDEAWHQFVLFTTEYTDYCHRFFGHYQHHMPANAPVDAARPPVTMATWEQFAARYEAMFGVPPGAVWHDHLSVHADRRLLWIEASAARRVEVEGVDAVLFANRAQGPEVVVRVSRWGADALRFLARHEAFYVRELPGPLEGDDKVALCSALVRGGYLRVAP